MLSLILWMFLHVRPVGPEPVRVSIHIFPVTTVSNMAKRSE
jgi:hypothetical protein